MTAVKTLPTQVTSGYGSVGARGGVAIRGRLRTRLRMTQMAISGRPPAPPRSSTGES
ncbi:MAG: hypothetical protein M1815_005510 [Lichina confinis]|nr:MAG: hypothetical protein M1815_005510 [Lichina confinis]